MDRRQRKTREAIFRAFSELLYKKDFSQITVGEIIERADVGRATFYSHFETKDFLLKEMCEELFCHLFDRESDNAHNHRHIFECNSSDAAYLHLLRHLRNNDNNILTLLSSHSSFLPLYSITPFFSVCFLSIIPVFLYVNTNKYIPALSPVLTLSSASLLFQNLF